MFTFNQIIDRLSTIAAAHQQVRSFGFGNLWDVEEKDRRSSENYPLVWATTETGRGSKGFITVNLKLLFMDLVHTDQSNENEVLSDQMQIMLDFIAQLKSPAYKDDFIVNDDFTFDDFTEKFTDLVAGYECNIGLKIRYTADRCSVPSTLVATGTGTCPVVTIYNANGTVNTTVVAGGTYTLAASGNATVQNSDATYSQTVAAGGTHTLADTTYVINVNGVEDQSFSQPSMIDLTINIS